MTKHKISLFENQISKAHSEGRQSNKMGLPDPNEIEAFSQKASEYLYRLNFESKKAIIRSVIDKVVGTKQELQVYGYIPVNNINVFTNHRNCGVAKCREIDAF